MTTSISPQADSERSVEMLWELWRRWRMRSKTIQTDITSEQYRLLKHLSRCGPLSVSALAGFWGVSVSAMSITTQRLERSGYVTRLRSPNDQRRVSITVTPLGTSAWQEWHQTRVQALAQVLETLPQADQTDLQRILNKLLDTPQEF